MTDLCQCGHDRDVHDETGRCQSGDDDGDGYFDQCYCTEFQDRSLPSSSTNGQVIVPVNHGYLTVDVWPAYMGLAESTDGVTLLEPMNHRDYARGQITWETKPDGLVVGHARVCLPKGIHTHLLFCHGPVEMIIGVEQMEHPVIFDRAGFFDVSPIVNKAYLPR